MPDETHELPVWLATEDSVSDIFTQFGFSVEHVTLHGRQIDITATRDDFFAEEPERWAIEVTTSYVNEKKGSSDYQKLDLMRQDRGCRLLMISTAGFAPDQKATLEKLGVRCRTYADLERTKLDLGRYAAVMMEKLSLPKDNDIGFDPAAFVDPDVKVHRNPSDLTASVRNAAAAWVRQVTTSADATVGALLGNLGTGKTTILQKVQLDLLREFRANPSQASVPIYVPLSAYKFHSGRVDSMVQEVLADAGLTNYPIGLMRSLARRGRVVFFFDGLDEVHPLTTVDDVLATVTRILDYLGRSVRAVISSRTHLFKSSSEELALFGPYETHKLQRVAGALQQLLAGHATTEVAYIQPFSVEQVNRYLGLTCGSKAGDVRRHIDAIYGFRDMSTTPVLLAMMRKTLPLLIDSKHTFGPFPHLDLYGAYTDRWLKRDYERAQLSEEQRRRLSRALSIELIKRDEFAAPWHEIREMLHRDTAWAENPISDPAAELDVRNSTLLVRDGDSHFRFVHRSIMEYFAAQVTLERLRVGERSERTLSDGHAEFLALMYADAWHAEGRPPVPRLHLDMDDWQDKLALGLLAAAVNKFPDGFAPRPPLEHFRIAGKAWEDLRLGNCSLSDGSIEIGAVFSLVFRHCDLRGVAIRIGKCPSLEFYECKIQGSHLALSLDQWRNVKLLPGGTEVLAGLDLPAHFTTLARWISQPGCSASVGGTPWTVPMATLVLADAAARRLVGKVKLGIDSWSAGSHGSTLGLLLPRLKGMDIIAEDTSRTPHQLSLTGKGQNLFVGLKRDPLAWQELLAAFAPP